MSEAMFFFLLGALVASLVYCLLWDEFQFRWTLRHGLSVDLFTMQPSDVRKELQRAVAEYPAISAARSGMGEPG